MGFQDHVTFNGTRYDFRDAGARAEIGDIKSAFDANCLDVLNFLHNTATTTMNGVTFTATEESIAVNGRATNTAFINYWNDGSALPFGIVPGKKYRIIYSGTNVRFRLFSYVNGSNATIICDTLTNTEVTIPANCSGLSIRLNVSSGVTVNETVPKPQMLTTMTNAELADGIAAFDAETDKINANAYQIESVNAKDLLHGDNQASSGSMNGVAYTWADGVCTAIGTPTAVSFSKIWSNADSLPDWLIAGKTYVFTVGATDPNLIVRVFFAYNGTFDDANGISVYNYKKVTIPSNASGIMMRVQPEYRQAVNGKIRLFVTDTMPSQTTTQLLSDHLTAYSDSTNHVNPLRNEDILSCLTAYGVCYLGEGDFYVSSLDMPANTSIIGSGRATRLYLSASGNGYAIKMGDHCCVQNLSIVGSLENIDVSALSTVGNRHGIVWQGTYSSDGNSPHMGIVDNVYISDFTGGGIYLDNTGYGITNGIAVSNCCMERCGAGIDIYYYSEFNKFTNVRSNDNYYGCINNGGNNVFVNCDFSRNKLGFLMDNSQGQSPNNSHGSAVGCNFHHTDGNSGTGIRILNCNAGYIFTGCQCFFSKIDIQGSDGIVISDTNFGQSNCDISVSGGGTVLFANNMHQGQPTITISNNQNVHFVNCYNRSTGAVIEP